MSMTKQGSLTLTNIEEDRRLELASTKGVQFQRSLTSSIKKEFADAPFELSDSIRANVWYTADEKNARGQECRDLVKDYRASSNNPSEIDQDFSTLYKDCSSLSATQVLRTKVVRNTLSEMAHSDGLRGLEVKLAKTMSQHRKQHIQTMLSIKEQGASEEVLAGSSAQSSRASQILARVLAQIDAREAVKN
eukprot:CAMPEP_0117081910 /NCGR_PEP_ID=MMETSP0472-20121206/57711_1 /TAXON_ID=693140 ORGANISM="Tiarina fusus, Strain LIS" /NCGR_SAMPLE_ID=MMETSP0472 /ASSEMBLY_ACC=CAM_ASM_000603 /LENGTH=190 /DNA_ID=CAMNT_0004809993 /DNA_START=56 /DNA_END=628 /DNA_ORIENTATION=+